MSSTTTVQMPPSTGQSSEPGPSVGPWPSGWPEFVEFGSIPIDSDPGPDTLPEPSIDEPFSIGEALYDPARVPAAVVSLLDLMRVGIYAADGTAVRPGDERDGDDLWLTEDEVRGLIEMGVADARAGYEDESGPYTFADLATALAPLLPTWSASKLAAAYDDSYAARPDDLVPMAMLGQPIMPETPLTRVQLWLLFVDGFLGPSSAVAIVPGALMAAGGPAWGTANEALPPIPSPVAGLSTIEFAQLLAHLSVVGWTIPFEVDPRLSSVHEGHDQAGRSVVATARIDLAAVARSLLVSPLTGRLLLTPRSSPSISGSITWTSSSQGLLAEHGTLRGPLGVPVGIGVTGAVSIGYDVRQEPPDRNGDEVAESADLTASIPLDVLVSAVYDVPIAARGFLFGTRRVSGAIRIEWHSKEGINLLLMNQYDVNLTGYGIDLGFGGSARGFGKDAATGFLEKKSDGTYRGIIFAHSIGSFSGEWAGTACTVLHEGSQELYVIGRPISGGNLQLAFYPTPARSLSRFPSDTCPLTDAWHIGWQGGGPDNQPPGEYLLFGSSRWTNPLVGYSVWLPDASQRERLYQDDDDTSEFGLSVWWVRTRYVGS